MTGELRKLRGAVFKLTKIMRERVDWQPKTSGRYGPRVMQMIQ